MVDDSITVRRVTQRLLERNGMRVMTAKDGVEAMAVLQEHVPDVILLDIEMPRMDGYEVAAHVRNDARIADVPIIMITSRVGDKHRARAIELGVDDYLGKPYQESQLLDAIEPLVLRAGGCSRRCGSRREHERQRRGDHAWPNGDELYCLLVPLAEDRLLLPRSCVTEVINYQAPDADGRRAALVPRHGRVGRPRACRWCRSRRSAAQALPRTSGRTRIVVHAGHHRARRRAAISRWSRRASRSWCA